MEEEIAFTCYPAITRTVIPAQRLETNILKNSTISTIILHATTSNNLTVFTAGSQSNLSPTDMILDTGANYSIMYQSKLSSNISTCNPVTFDRLSGSINITQTGSLGNICDTYYHRDMIANIVSESAITSQGYTLTYDTNADLSTLNHLGDLSTFTRRDNGLHVCNSGHPHVYCQGLPTQISHIT